MGEIFLGRNNYGSWSFNYFESQGGCHGKMIGWISIIGRGSDNGCLKNLGCWWDKNGINFISLGITFVAVIGSHLFFLMMEDAEGIGGKMDCFSFLCFEISKLLNGHTVFGGIKIPHEDERLIAWLLENMRSNLADAFFACFFRTIVQVAVVNLSLIHI